MAVLNRAKSSFSTSKHETYIDHHSNEACLPPEILMGWPSVFLPTGLVQETVNGTASPGVLLGFSDS